MMNPRSALLWTILCILSQSVSATQLDMCVERPRAAGCAYFYARYSNTPLFIEPNLASKVVSNVAAGQPVSIDWAATRNAKRGWAFIKKDGTQHKDNAAPFGWIEAKNIAGDADFAVVSDCWPFSSISNNDSSDTPALKMTFFRSGREKGGRNRVWFTPNIVRIGESLSVAGPLGYDSAAISLFDPVVSQEASVTTFSEYEMKGCPGGKLVVVRP